MKVLCKKDFCLTLYEDSNNDMYSIGEYYSIEYEEEKTYCIRFNGYNSVHFIKNKLRYGNELNWSFEDYFYSLKELRKMKLDLIKNEGRG